MRGSGVISRIFHSNGRLLVRSSSSSSQGTEEKVDPVSAYTATGGLKKPKRDVFHYSDRKSGTGYSHFSSTIYENRPYLWPPLRKMYKYNYFIVFVLALLMILDYEKFVMFCLVFEIHFHRVFSTFTTFVPSFFELDQLQVLIGLNTILMMQIAFFLFLLRCLTVW